MRTIAIAVAFLFLPVLCLGNPTPYADLLYLDVDGSNCAYPAASSMFSVTLTLREPQLAWEGLTGVSFMLEETAGVMYLSTTNLIGGLVIGTPSEGISLSGECTPPENGIITICDITYLYLGVPGTMTCLPDPYQGQVFTDCNVDLRTWHVPQDNGWPGGYLGINMEPPGGCLAVPVENVSWGSIKALYR